MKNKLEDFIRENRQDMDGFEPNEALWNKISSKLDEKEPKKRINIRFWVSAAASVVIIFSVWLYANKENVATSQQIAAINPAYAEKQNRFINLIEEKKDSLAHFKDVDPVLIQNFSNDLVMLDAAYEKLQSEMANSPNKETIVKAMIRNREMQLQTLRQQLMVLNQISELKTQHTTL